MTSTQKTTSIYLADDHQIVIDGLKLLISNELNLRIVGSAISGTVAHAELLQKKPDIALVDYRMPGMNGIDLISSLKKKIETKFIILSMHNEKRYVEDAKSYGACGYLLKNTGKEELMHCIDKVIQGGIYFSPGVYSTSTPREDKFTPREMEILRMIISGDTTQEISKTLNLSHFTVETHRKNICRKANTKTIIGLLKYIKNSGIEV